MNWGFVVPFVIGCQVISYIMGYLGNAFTHQAWIDDTPKPKLWPHWIVFPLIWIVNYTLMGQAVWLIWQQRSPENTDLALLIFAVHLIHNLSFLFVVYQVKKRSFYALMDFIGLVLTSITTLLFFGIDSGAGFLMLPYLAWMGYTTLIKILWWRMEPSVGLQNEL